MLTRIIENFILDISLFLSFSLKCVHDARRITFCPKISCEDSAIECYCPGHPNRPPTVVQENSLAVRKRLVQLPKAIGVSSLFIGMILASQRVANGINQIQYEAWKRKFLSYRYEARFRYRYWMITNRAFSIRYTVSHHTPLGLGTECFPLIRFLVFLYQSQRKKETLPPFQPDYDELSRHVYFICPSYTRKMRLRITKITFDLQSFAVYNNHRDKLPPTRCIFVAAI
jgi:hypothetical protein